MIVKLMPSLELNQAHLALAQGFCFAIMRIRIPHSTDWHSSEALRLLAPASLGSDFQSIPSFAKYHFQFYVFLITTAVLTQISTAPDLVTRKLIVARACFLFWYEQ